MKEQEDSNLSWIKGWLFGIVFGICIGAAIYKYYLF